jgi:succinate dehydrogenase flavin-adding protein (antitoxin of CptAB toxin-antitoxin module)
MEIQYLVSSVLELYYDDDIQTLDDLQFYIYEQYDEMIDKEILKLYFNEKIRMDEEDIKLQYKHIGL